MQRKKKPIRSAWLKKLLRIHMVVTVLALGAYFSVAFFDPGFLSYDLRQKYHALADDLIVITATVLDPPAQPVVTTIATCDENTGILSVTLDWADDTNAYTYDIDRDGLPLVTGLTSSGYIDTGVSPNTTYEYTVIARGPTGPGFATSLPVSATTSSECGGGVVASTVNIVSFGGREVGSYDGTPRVRDRRPTFSGTTNMPNAIIQVVVGPKNSLIAEFVANANGYWEWRPPVGLATGTQTFTVTAVDPDDSTRQATASLRFGIIMKRGEDTDDVDKEAVSPIGSETIQAPAKQQAPVDFSLSVENNDNAVLQGQDLQAVLKIMDVAAQYNGTLVPVRYSFVDGKGGALFSVTRETLIQKGGEIRENLPIALYMAVGKYSLQAEILFDKVNVSRTTQFSVVALPFLQIGGKTTITYAEMVRNLGWLSFVLIILLLLWLLMFMREYWMYLHAIRSITEQHLEKAGFFGKRKGVVR